MKIFSHIIKEMTAYYNHRPPLERGRVAATSTRYFDPTSGKLLARSIQLSLLPPSSMLEWASAWILPIYIPKLGCQSVNFNELRYLILMSYLLQIDHCGARND